MCILLVDIHSTVRDTWFNKLIDHYTSPKRQCHGLNDLYNCLKHYESSKEFLKNPNAVFLALLFRHFEYDPKDTNCSEVNINHFKKFADESKLCNDLCDEVISLLKVASINSTDEHKIEGCFGYDDTHYFLDIDMAVLGMSPTEYKNYINQVRKEYDFLDENSYKDLRLKILENFLQIPNIYATEFFRQKYELAARSNIQKEINVYKTI
ncbi:uncharacterized protein LOC126903787 isoform X2 [Daktulosphaira vitifoliae]|uniref:uncharacterized protein LOC126903787 isoform X2 n=1 Tax=Daktulosphaira vitifoliae TaxID=58002 RepID=UPI0021AA96C7|nr:uncharacterized protein LOC126903787 isoform X2 [Daktulosphaira vitifoliae]